VTLDCYEKWKPRNIYEHLVHKEKKESMTIKKGGLNLKLKIENNNIIVIMIMIIILLINKKRVITQYMCIRNH